MKKLMIISAMIFALGFIPAVSYAVGMGNPNEHSSMAREHKATKSGETSFEYQASRVIGNAVKNRQGDFVGRIEELRT